MKPAIAEAVTYTVIFPIGNRALDERDTMNRGPVTAEKNVSWFHCPVTPARILLSRHFKTMQYQIKPSTEASGHK
jgi:hypothetical protein